VDRTRRYPPSARCGVLRALEVTSHETPAHGPFRGPKDTGCLLDGVVLLSFAHMGSIPLPEAFAPVLEAVKRREALTFAI
jgi:hypothetical protein